MRALGSEICRRHNARELCHIMCGVQPLKLSLTSEGAVEMTASAGLNSLMSTIGDGERFWRSRKKCLIVPARPATWRSFVHLLLHTRKLLATIMQFFTLALAALSAFAAAQSSISRSAAAVSSIAPAPVPVVGSAVNATRANVTSITTIYATRTVTISGAVTVVTVSTVTSVGPRVTTMLAVPTTVTVAGRVQTVIVAIPIVGGTVVNSGVGSMTLAVPTAASTASARASTTAAALPTVTRLPTGSSATKVVAGSLAGLFALVVLVV